MTEYVTLEVVGDAGGSEAVKSREKKATFADGTEQSVFIGLRKTTRSTEFTRTLDEAEALALYNRLQAYLENGTIFWYALMPRMPKRLYKIGGESLGFAHVAGMSYKVTATFEEWYGGF